MLYGNRFGGILSSSPFFYLRNSWHQRTKYNFMSVSISELSLLLLFFLFSATGRAQEGWRLGVCKGLDSHIFQSGHRTRFSFANEKNNLIWFLKKKSFLPGKVFFFSIWPLSLRSYSLPFLGLEKEWGGEGRLEERVFERLVRGDLGGKGEGENRPLLLL